MAAVQTQRDRVPPDLPKTLHDALYVPGDGEVNEAWSQRLSIAAWELLFTLAALARDMVIEAKFHPHSELEVDRLRGLDGRVVEGHCACPAEDAVVRYNARSRNEVHWVKTATQTTMDKYDRPVGIGSLITVDTAVPVDVVSVAAEVRRAHWEVGHARVLGEPAPHVLAPRQPSRRAWVSSAAMTSSGTSRISMSVITAS